MAARKRSRKRFWVGVLVLFVAVGLAVGFQVHRSDAAKAEAAESAPQAQTDINLADLGSAQYQQGIDTQFTADLKQLQASPNDPAHSSAVTSACGLVGQMTTPLPVDEDAWVTANCVDASQEAHPGAYAGGGSN
jgi:hypothetical protein